MSTTQFRTKQKSQLANPFAISYMTPSVCLDHAATTTREQQQVSEIRGKSYFNKKKKK